MEQSAVLGLVMSLTPLSCDLMGLGGAGGNGAASTSAYTTPFSTSQLTSSLSGVFFFMGGLLMILGGIMEFLLGNTFPFVLFCGYGTKHSCCLHLIVVNSYSRKLVVVIWSDPSTILRSL